MNTGAGRRAKQSEDSRAGPKLFNERLQQPLVTPPRFERGKSEKKAQRLALSEPKIHPELQPTEQLLGSGQMKSRRRERKGTCIAARLSHPTQDDEK